MRNDADDELNELPSLVAEPKHSSAYAQPLPAASSAPRKGVGLLWALVIALAGALIALGMWSQQQVELMAQQLVATQESFAHISEQAAGRIQAISGQVVATESTVNSESEQLKLRLNHQAEQLKEAKAQSQTLSQALEKLVRADQARTVQTNQLSAALEEQAKQVQALSTELKTSAQTLTQLQSSLVSLSEAQTTLKAGQAQTQALAEQLSALKTELEAVRKSAGDTQRITSLEQDLMLLRAQLDSAPSAAQGAPLAEFDAYRAQVTRQLNTLNSQVQSLHQQLNAR